MMPNTIQVTGDDEPFIIQQEAVDEGVMLIRQQLQGISETTICVDCGEEIGKARKKAMPNTIRCIDCATEHEKVSS